MQMYELIARYDSRQSFYHKAVVHIEKNKTTLYSYETPVAVVSNGKLKLLPDWNYSNTTRRHVKEFVKQLNVESQYDELRRKK